jgi:hypothetical protein
MNEELRRVLGACYACWARSPALADERQICYTWVIGVYQERFGGTFHQSKLRQLAGLGFLCPGDVARGGSRRYYWLMNPEGVCDLAREWGLS